jgi:hypothetical protein
MMPTWAMDQVDVRPVFKDEAHAQNAYEKVRREVNPQSASEMRDARVEEVMRRREEFASGMKICDERCHSLR